MNKLLEQLVYMFGVNFSAYDVDIELHYLSKNLNKKYKNRNVVDIGCGDGSVSLKLKSILKPKSFIGVDVYETLVESAKKKGINARVLDVEKQDISGDLGIMWGVLHHLNDPIGTLKKLKNNFNNLIIRECIDENRILEAGHKLNKVKLMEILEKAGVEIIKVVEVKENKSLIIIAR
ncbi:Ribosomal RNA large subunit methyltransferase G [bacterium HR34]|nr:Ribosomal RNA large subunit methyltransferase G [bacterium HR34]